VNQLLPSPPGEGRDRDVVASADDRPHAPRPLRTCASLRALTLLGTVVVLAAHSPAIANELPNRTTTPGAVITRDRSLICVRGYAQSVRHRYDGEWLRFRTAMFREYGLPHARWRDFTVDHLVPIELGGEPFGVIGGRRDLRNVWPEPKAEARRKDAVEDALHAAVCYRRGYHGVHLTVVDAQRAIAHDWMQTPVGIPPPRD